MAQRKLDVVLDSVKRLMRMGATANLVNLLQKQHPADLAQLFSELAEKDRQAAFTLLAERNSKLAMEALSELSPEAGAALLADRSAEDAVNGHAQGRGFPVHGPATTDDEVRVPHEIQAVEGRVRNDRFFILEPHGPSAPDELTLFVISRQQDDSDPVRATGAVHEPLKEFLAFGIQQDRADLKLSSIRSTTLSYSPRWSLG